jgi:hypothetical protein
MTRPGYDYFYFWQDSGIRCSILAVRVENHSTFERLYGKPFQRELDKKNAPLRALYNANLKWLAFGSARNPRAAFVRVS